MSPLYRSMRLTFGATLEVAFTTFFPRRSSTWGASLDLSPQKTDYWRKAKLLVPDEISHGLLSRHNTYFHDENFIAKKNKTCFPDDFGSKETPVIQKPF